MSQVRGQPAPANERGFIDAHAHVWTPDTQAYPRAAAFAGKKEVSPRSFTPEELMAHCRPEGVARVVLIQMSFYQYDNRYMLDAIAARPSDFRGVAVVDETSPGVVATMQHLAGQGVRGFRLYADKARAETWGDSAGMKAMWTYAADAGLAICPLANPDALPAVQRMCARFPRTRVVLDHFARVGGSGVIVPDDLDRLCRLADFEHTHVKVSAFYALGAKQPPYTDLAPMIRRVRDAFGAARLMWASDCPFQVEAGRTYRDSIVLVRDRIDFLTAEERTWLLRRTAEKLFFS